MKGFLYHQRQTLTEGKARLKKTVVSAMAFSLMGIIVDIIVFSYFSAGTPCSNADKISSEEQPYCKVHSSGLTGVVRAGNNRGGSGGSGVITYLVDELPLIVPPVSGATEVSVSYVDTKIQQDTFISHSFFMLSESQFSFNVSVHRERKFDKRPLSKMALCITTEKGYKHFEMTKTCSDKYALLSMEGTAFWESDVVVNISDLYHFAFYSAENDNIAVAWDFHVAFSTFNITDIDPKEKCMGSSVCRLRRARGGDYIIATYNGTGSVPLSMQLFADYTKVYGIYSFFLCGFLLIGIVTVIVSFRSFYNPMKYISRAEILAQVNGDDDDDDDDDDSEDD